MFPREVLQNSSLSAEFRRIPQNFIYQLYRSPQNGLTMQSSAEEFCGIKVTRRILQDRFIQFRRLLQASAECYGVLLFRRTILRNIDYSAEFCRILQKSAELRSFSPKCSAEFCGTSAEFCRFLHGSAELGKIRFLIFLFPILKNWKFSVYSVECWKNRYLQPLNCAISQ